jgi:hypothetical protein
LKDREQELSSEVMNSANAPRRVGSDSSPDDTRGKNFDVHFEPLSLTLLELELK